MAGFIGALVFALIGERASAAANDWPAISSIQRPWTYWWWMASAVDEKNITRELTRYRDAGLGGVHIIPIYGARGFESNYITYLSPRWMQMLDYTVREAQRLGLGVDMTTGSGWCFGGPNVTDADANASLVSRQLDVAAGGVIEGNFKTNAPQALMAFGSNGERIDLLPRVKDDGSVDWSPESGSWKVFAISQRPSPQKVKRPGPGGEGWMLNLFHAPAMTHFLEWFGEPFIHYKGARPRAQYHDSYEYRSEWAPGLFDTFQQRRGYSLRDELPAFFGLEGTERAARVKSDYRETLSDIMTEVTLPMWVKWSHDRGYITRNEAHGSPGNLLDLYALADIPETEMFHTDRNKMISKFASSAAHVAGRPLCSSETGTWLKEHFTETLGDMKHLLDDLFLSGVNHIFYHGSCYSPDEAGWPGWLFYASYEMNPRNSVWHHVDALNLYAARCQSVLQAGSPDNDVLVYWPIHDRWNDARGMVQPFTVHARDWFEQQPIGHAAEWLWQRGYQFDFISDKQLGGARVQNGFVRVPGGDYRVILVPACEFMPLPTLSKLVQLAEAGATVIFEKQLPRDVPGLANLESRREAFQRRLDVAQRIARRNEPGTGGILIGALESVFPASGTPREQLFDEPGLMCIRRKVDDGRYYFIANRGTNAFEGWLPLATEARRVVLMDPLSGATGVGRMRARSTQGADLYLQLPPGASIIVRTHSKQRVRGAEWNYFAVADNTGPLPLPPEWKLNFVKGGPELPNSADIGRTASWTTLDDTNAQRFAGTGRYTLRFDAPGSRGKTYRLDLGNVGQSARVTLNGRGLGTLITAPFTLNVDNLKRRGNVLEVEVANVSANRIRDLDQRKVNWRNFRDINFVNINYRPFDASEWPLTDSGLLGPVSFTPLAKLKPQ
ncbi:MAG TPA: glycosyl hydrolase [Verrucomicrobiae bacterium]|nr:glycosyl hydrolase [Verrucomicrobiae bacterium]